MDKLIINRSKWCKGYLGKTKNGKFYSCAVGQYLSALGISSKLFDNWTSIPNNLEIPEEGNWLRDYGHCSLYANTIMGASGHKYEKRVIELFRYYANISVTFEGNYPGSR